MMKSKKSVSVVLLIIITMAIMSVLSPTKVFAEGKTSESKDLFSDFNISIENEGKDEAKLKVDSGANENPWGTLLSKYKGFITGIAAVGAVTMVVLFIIQFLKLGASAGNPSARSQALVGVLWTGIAAAGLGAVAIITGIFYNAV